MFSVAVKLSATAVGAVFADAAATLNAIGAMDLLTPSADTPAMSSLPELVAVVTKPRLDVRATSITAPPGSSAASIVEPAAAVYSYSSARQAVTIPADAISATLRFWLYPMSAESPANPAFPARPLASTIQDAILSNDAQYVLILDESDQRIGTLIWQRRDDRMWTFHQFDLDHYADQTIKLQFGVYNDGWDGVTAMYVDDVSLEVCPATAAPP